MTRTECKGGAVVARYLALIVVAQKSEEGGKGKKRVRGSCEGRMGWDFLEVSCAVVKGEAMGMRL